MVAWQERIPSAVIALARPWPFISFFMKVRPAVFSVVMPARESSISSSRMTAPEVVHLAVDSHADLVEVPPTVGEGSHPSGSIPVNLGGEHRAEPVPTGPHGLVADVDPQPGQQVVHVPQRRGRCTYIITAVRIISGEPLRQRKGLVELAMPATPGARLGTGNKFGLTKPAQPPFARWAIAAASAQVFPPTHRPIDGVISVSSMLA